MKQLLTCLAYVYALVLVPNSVAAQTICMTRDCPLSCQLFLRSIID